MSISIETQIRLLQANFIPDEMEERTEPWPASRVWTVRIIAFVASWALAAGAAYCAYRAWQAFAG